jgi:peptide chain release factor 1
VEQDQLAEWQRELEAVREELAGGSAVGDSVRLARLARRHKELGALVEAGQRLEAARSDLEAARELYAQSSAAEREVAKLEVEHAEAEVSRIEGELRELLVPRDPNAGRDVMVEIRGAEGGEEANLFARDLFDMYQRYADKRGWRLSVLSLDPSPRDGLNEVVFTLSGPDAWQRMKHEGGPHRVQRVPVTESQGRIHTSSATVTVMPVADEVEVTIDPADLRIDVYRSTGPGGQSVNTTDSAVRITHIPTGIVVSMQDEKSQIQNRAKAMQVLRSRLLKAERDRLAEEASEQRRSQVGRGGRAEKVRTYNFKENRVTDHRVKLTLHKLDRVLEGELDEIVDALLADERSRQLAEADA